MEVGTLELEVSKHEYLFPVYKFGSEVEVKSVGSSPVVLAEVEVISGDCTCGDCTCGDCTCGD